MIEQSKIDALKQSVDLVALVQSRGVGLCERGQVFA